MYEEERRKNLWRRIGAEKIRHLELITINCPTSNTLLN